MRCPSLLIERPDTEDLSEKKVPLPNTLDPIVLGKLKRQKDMRDVTLQLLY
jgi:hypothetical protein